MLTLQILDGGQTFLHPLHDQPVSIGSGTTAHIVLRESDVAPVHVSIEPTANGARLVAKAPTRVNGTAVQTADLVLGDRIEIGRAVVVVGRTVPRAAGPDDVLAEAVPRSRRKAGSAKTAWLLPVAVVAVLAGSAFVFLQARDDAAELAAIRQLRFAGQFEEAARKLTVLEQAWTDRGAEALQRLQPESKAIAAAQTATARLFAAVRAPEDGRGYAEWSQELRRLENDGDEAERIAAAIVRDQLAATLRTRPAPTPTVPAVAVTPPPDSVPAVRQEPPRDPVVVAPGSQASTPVVKVEPPAAQPAASGETAPKANAEDTVAPDAAVDLADVERLCRSRLFVQAVSLLQANLARESDEAAVAKMSTRITAVREEAKAALATLLAEVAQVARERGPREAAQVLHAARTGFPPTREFAAIEDTHKQLLAEAAARPPVASAGQKPASEALRIATLASLRARMDSVRLAEQGGDFAEAGRLLVLAADEVRSRDADFAQRLQTRAAEAELLASFHRAVATALQAGRTFRITAPTGSAAEVVGVDGGALRLEPGAQRMTWHELGGAAVAAIAQQCGIVGKEALGAAALLYKQGDGAAAEALLAKVVMADANAKESVDRVIARGRGEPFDPRGYEVGKDGFVSVRSLEIQKQAAALAARMDTALRDKNLALREELLAEALAAGPEAVDVLAAALQKELTRQVTKLDAGALRKHVDKLAKQRAELDAARHQARELIQDEKRYFYPYKPPAVSSEKYAEYVRVQAEVNRRVDAVRTLWDDDTVRVRVPATLRAELDRIDWLARALGDLGELDHAQLAPIEWARALPVGDTVGLRDFCATLAERAELEEWRHVEAFNQAVGKSFSSAQREQLRVTNDYRAMFRHRPLAIVAAICTAAQGHAEEMGRLGYFAHMSPTPGRRTPYDRMKLAGYEAGVSENIAMVDGALGAHNAWCQSSGHHRNLLDPGHREMGIGADGRLWVQNFGGGTVHRQDPAWATSGAPAAGH